MTITEVRTADSVLADAFTALVEARRAKVGYLVREHSLRQLADDLDIPLCAWCLTPHDVTVRSCCDTPVCDMHTEDHDLNRDDACPEFAAQLREGA